MEQTILFLINREWTSPFLDHLMAAVTSWDFWWPFFVLGGIFIAVFGGFRGRALLICFGLAILFADGFAVRNGKHFVQRARPHDVVEGVRNLDLERATPRFLALGQPLRVSVSDGAIVPVGGGSFPSGHAANNFAIATVLTVFYRRWGWLFFLPATLIAYSRVYVGVHWPLDVLLSAFLGTGMALLALAAAELCWQKLGRKWVPRLAADHPSLFAK